MSNRWFQELFQLKSKLVRSHRQRANRNVPPRSPGIESLEARSLLSAVVGTTTTELRSQALPNASPISFSHTVTAGSDRLLVVSVGVDGNEGVSTMTYNGVTMTEAIRHQSGTGESDVAVEVWYLVNPPEGTANVVITLDTTASPWGVTAMNLTGVNQTTPIGATLGATASTGSPSVNITTTTSDALILASAVKDHETASFTPGGGISERWDTPTGVDNGDIAIWGGTLVAASPGAFTMSATSSQSTEDWAIAAIEIISNTSVNVSLTIEKDFSNNDPTDAVEETVTAGGSSQTFTIVVTNTGTSTANNVHVTDTVDSRLVVESVSASPSLGSDQDGSAQGIDWLISSLSAGQTVTLTVTYHVDSATDSALVNNTASVYSNEVSSVSNSDDVQIVENVLLTIEKDFSNNDPTDTTEETVTAGGSSQTFTIVVTNTGTSTANNVHITDTVDSRLVVESVSASVGSDQDGSAQGIDWLISSLAASQTVTLTVTYHVDAATDSALVDNSAAVDSDEVSSVSNSDDVQIVENVALSIVKDFADASVQAGTSGHTFTIQVTNTGLSDADNVTISDVVPSELEVTALSSDLGGSATESPENTIGATLAHLAAGATWTITVTYGVPSNFTSGNITNTATADSDEATAVNDSDSVLVTENAAPAIQVVKSADPTSVSEGGVGSQSVTYTYQVTNTSAAGIADPLSNISISDTDGTPTYVSGDDGDELLETGETWTFTLTKTVTAQNSGASHSNTVSVSGQDDEGNTANDTDEASVDFTDVAPTVTITKSVDANEDGTFSASESVLALGIGDQKVDYKYVVTNTSPASTDPVTVTSLDDDKLGSLLSAFLAANGGSAVLLPGASVTFYVNDHVVPTQASGTNYTNTVTVSGLDDEESSTNVSTATATVTYTQPGGMLVVGSDHGTNSQDDKSQPAVKIFDPVTKTLSFTILPSQTYGESYRGGVRVATGDINGDGIADIVTAPGRLMAPNLKVFSGLPDGSNQAIEIATSGLTANRTYGANFSKGVYVAVGDVDNDGRNDIVISPEMGRADIKVFRNLGTIGRGTPSEVTRFAPAFTFNAFSDFSYRRYIGGATVAVADVAGDSKAEIIVGSGAGTAAVVRVFDYTRFAMPSILPDIVFATQKFEIADRSRFMGGIYVSAGDVAPPLQIDASGVGKAEIITSSAAGALKHGAGSMVQIYRVDFGFMPRLINSFQTFPDAADVPNAGARVAVLDGKLFAVQGSDGRSQYQVRKFNRPPATTTPAVPQANAHIDAFFAGQRDPLDPYFFGGGLFIAALNHSVAT